MRKPRSSVMDVPAGVVWTCPYCPDFPKFIGNDARKAHNASKHPTQKGKRDGKPTRHGKINRSLFRPSQEG